MNWFGKSRLQGIIFGLLSVLVITGKAAAEEMSKWSVSFQEPVTPVMEQIVDLHGTLTILITLIVLFVFGLLAYVVLRFRASKNPEPATFAHNTKLEIIWTAIPVLILALIAGPSMRLLYYMDRTHEADMTIKAIGHQWYWSYEYPDHGNFTFDALMVDEADLEEGQPRLLATDNKIVLPVNKNIRLLATSDDVIHSWAIPSFGIKVDTVPGRTNESWVRIEKEGTYYGQCSELCGVNHGFMPIAVEAVSQEKFEAWVAEAKEQFARVDGDDVTDKPVNVAKTESKIIQR